MKHTRGPWMIHPYGEAVLSLQMGRVCHIITQGGTMTPEKMSNAVLIAAAPDMLDALIAIREAEKNGKIVISGRDATITSALIESMIAQATNVPEPPIQKGCDNCGRHYMNGKKCYIPDVPKQSPCISGSKWIPLNP